MSNLKSKGMRNFFILVACALIFAACNEGQQLIPSNNDDMIEVSFGFNGDYVSIDEAPLTKAIAPNAKTLYALQVYSTDTTNKGHRLEESRTRPYAYGLFDDISNIRLALPKDRKFIVKALIIEEREDTIYHNNGYYDKPFSDLNDIDYFDIEHDDITLSITNQFIVTGGDSRFDAGIATSSSSGCGMKKVDRYCGYQRFNSSSTRNINIKMERYAFAFTYDVVPPFDGTIRVKFYDNILYEVKAGDGQKTKQVIYGAPFNYICEIDPSFIKLDEDYLLEKKEQQSTDINLLIEWERESENLESHTEEITVNIKRKTNYDIYINMNNHHNKSSFGFDFTNESEFTEGQSIRIN